MKPRIVVTKLYDTDLYKFIQTKELEMTFTMGLYFVIDIASAMRAVHNADTVHRDIKSPNILLETIDMNGKFLIRAISGWQEWLYLSNWKIKSS